MNILVELLVVIIKLSALTSSLLLTGFMLYSVNKNKDVAALMKDRTSGIFLLFITSITIYLVIK